jgi:hypothetical protein
MECVKGACRAWNENINGRGCHIGVYRAGKVLSRHETTAWASVLCGQLKRIMTTCHLPQGQRTMAMTGHTGLIDEGNRPRTTQRQRGVHILNKDSTCSEMCERHSQAPPTPALPKKSDDGQGKEGRSGLIANKLLSPLIHRYPEPRMKNEAKSCSRRCTSCGGGAKQNRRASVPSSRAVFVTACRSDTRPVKVPVQAHRITH